MRLQKAVQMKADDELINVAQNTIRLRTPIMAVKVTENEPARLIPKNRAMKNGVTPNQETGKPTLPAIRKNPVPVTKHRVHPGPVDLQQNVCPGLQAAVPLHLYTVTAHQEAIARVQHEAVVQVSAQVVHQDQVQAVERVQDQAAEPAQVPAVQVIRENAESVYHDRLCTKEEEG